MCYILMQLDIVRLSSQAWESESRDVDRGTNRQDTHSLQDGGDCQVLNDDTMALT